MIIVLKGADFSESNIGTLSTCIITRSLGSGTTYSGPSYVDKGTAFKATITIAKGYIIGAAGVAVTMGGKAVSSGVTITGSTITIDIASVTGNILIKVPTEVVYTVTYRYIDLNGAIIKDDETETVIAGTYKEFSTEDAPIIDGYTASFITPAIVTVNSNTTVIYTYTSNESTDYETVLISKTSGFDYYNRLATDAYVANKAQKIPGKTKISYIDIALANLNASGNKLVQESVSIPALSVWAFNANTNLMIEQLVNEQGFISVYSDELGGQVLRVAINKSYDEAFYFGFSNTARSDIGLAYYNASGNYLSGVPFSENIPLESGSGSVSIHCAIYGQLPKINTSDLEKVAEYNLDAASVVAGNCYIAADNQTVAANTPISKLVIGVNSDKEVTGINIFVVNADTNTVIEQIANEDTQYPLTCDDFGGPAIEYDLNKTYDHPIYFLFNADRTGAAPQQGLRMKSGAVPGHGILMTDENAPTVGSVLTATTTYGISHIVYS